MNTVQKSLSAAALLALGLVSPANADTIYITGSTAFRSVAFQALTNSFDAIPTIATRDGSAASGNNANWMVFHGTVATADEWVACHWTGSEDGIASVATPGSFPENWLLTDGTVTGISSSKPSSTETNASAGLFVPDFCFADSSQAASLTPTPALTGAGTNTPAGICGVVPFVWAKNTNSSQVTGPWVNLTNINDSGARKILNGKQKAALLTGIATDATNFVYCVGRNNRSGTRVDTLAVSKYGIKTVVVQYSIGGNPFVGGLTLASAGFNGGYNSGGDVAKALLVDGSMEQADPISGGTGWLAVGYLGIGDAKTLGTAFWLTYQGVPYNDGNVEEGHYNFWNYEYIYGKSGITGQGATLAANLANFLVPSFSGGSSPSAIDTSVGLTFMNATKASDTADPSHK